MVRRAELTRARARSKPPGGNSARRSAPATAIFGESRDWYKYDLPAELAGRLWRGRFRGQTQKWFAFRFAGDDLEINPNRDTRVLAWKWVEPVEVPQLIVPFKRDIYAAILEEFAPYWSR